MNHGLRERPSKDGLLRVHGEAHQADPYDHNMSRTYHHHLAAAAKLQPRHLREVVSQTESFNAKTALVITAILGSMAFFWVTVCLSLVSLPAVLTLVVPSLKATFPAFLIKASLISLVAWVAQTFIQLVALPVLQVSNNAQARQGDASTRTLLDDGNSTRAHTEEIIDLLRLDTEGGLKQLKDELVAELAVKL